MVLCCTLMPAWISFFLGGLMLLSTWSCQGARDSRHRARHAHTVWVAWQERKWKFWCRLNPNKVLGLDVYVQLIPQGGLASVYVGAEGVPLLCLSLLGDAKLGTVNWHQAVVAFCQGQTDFWNQPVVLQEGGEGTTGERLDNEGNTYPSYLAQFKGRNPKRRKPSVMGKLLCASLCLLMIVVLNYNSVMMARSKQDGSCLPFPCAFPLPQPQL